MKLRRRLFSLCAGIAASFLVASSHVTAQTGYEIDIPVENALRISNFVWSFDNQTLVFFNYDLIENPIDSFIDLPDPAWQSYNIKTGVFTAGETHFPLQPILSPTEISQFQPYEGYELILPSPDGNLIAFARRDSEGPSQLTFANRMTGEFHRAPLIIDFPLLHEGGLSKYWSEQGNVFIFPQSSLVIAAVTYYYIHVLEGNLSETIIRPFSPIIGGERYDITEGYTDRYLDMSREGDRVLAIARTTVPDPMYPISQIFYLVVWTTANDAESYRIPAVNGEDICDAAFTPDDNGITILLRDGRMLVYRIATQDVLLLPATVTPECGFTSEFSPNGEWLASRINDQLVVFHITDLIAQAPPVLQPPTADAGEDVFLIDHDGDGLEQTILSGLKSFDSDGEIVRYVWSYGAAEIPRPNAEQLLSFELGRTTLTLTVIDDNGLRAVDEVTVVVESSETTSEVTQAPA